MAKDFYTIRELLKAANQVKGYGASSIAKKELGKIYAFNKVLRVIPRQSIVEVSMLIKGVTDMIGSGDARKPVAAHRVRVLIRGVENEEVTAAELVKRIRAEHPELSDKAKYPNRDILEEVRKGKEFLKNKVTMEVNRVILEEKDKIPKVRKLIGQAEDGTEIYEEKDLPSKWTFAIISKEISPDCYIQVNCTCSSYYWTFQYPNGMNNVDIQGKKACKSYVNYVTSDVKRNPQNKVGVCKHIMLMLGMLMHEKVIDQVRKGGNSPATVYALNMEKFRTSHRLTRNGFKNLAKRYKEDLQTKRSSRTFQGRTPIKKKKSKYAPPKQKVPKGTMGTRGNRRKKK